MLKVTKRLKGFKSIENLAPNQTIVYFENGSLFQSYNSIIAVRLRTKAKETTYIGKDWEYSNTTGKYRNQYLGEDKKTTQSKIDSKEYKYKG